jgi:hypothetical protein
MKRHDELAGHRPIARLGLPSDPDAGTGLGHGYTIA